MDISKLKMKRSGLITLHKSRPLQAIPIEVWTYSAFGNATMAIWRAANLQNDVYLTIIIVRKCWIVDEYYVAWVVDEDQQEATR